MFLGGLRTREVCLAAVSQPFSGYGALQFVPKVLKTEEMCRAAVMANGSNIAYVTKPSEGLCAIACTKSGLAYDLIPARLRTELVEFCASLHGYHRKSVDAAYQDLIRARPNEAEALAQKYEALFHDLHHPGASAEDLEEARFAQDLSSPRER